MSAVQIQERVDEIEAARWPNCSCCGRALIWMQERGGPKSETFGCRHCGIAYDEKRKAAGLL